MNARNVKDLARELAGMPVESLDGKAVVALGKSLEKHIDAIRRTAARKEAEELLLRIPEHERRLYDQLLKRAQIKKPGKTASAQDWRNYARKLSGALERIEPQAREARTRLKRIAKADRNKALAELAALDADGRKHLSWLAQLTKPDGKALNLSASSKNHADWLDRLSRSRINTILD